MWESEDSLQEWVPSFRDGSGDQTQTIRLEASLPTEPSYRHP